METLYKITISGSGTTEEICEGLKTFIDQFAWQKSKKHTGIIPSGTYELVNIIADVAEIIMED